MPRREDPDRTKVALVDPWMGQLIAGRYRLELRIAAGGFGAIYRALDLATDRDVALKLLHASLAQDEGVAARFRREGAALARLRDPHTVAAYEVGETDDGTLFIAMELLGGDSLHTVFQEQGPMSWRNVAAIARAVCSSLREAHAQGIIHRDLKPANIHLEGEHRDFVKVLDFGIAKIVGGALDNSDLTSAGQMIGTFDYMPPEQMVGGETTGKSDVYALGIVMYELLVGQRPFGDLPTAASMLAAMLSTIPRSPAQRRVSIPHELDRAIMRCLAQKPEDRPTVDELAHLLDVLIEEDEDRTHVEPFRHVDHTTDRVPKQRQTPPPMMDEFPSGEQTVIDRGAYRSPPANTLPGIAPPKKPR
ncbi:MAG TPA: serine/threonine-protein kinase [Kofleriaceae bacterium]|jgi:serine/threonine-protein kinase